jgi:hypothetical protein
MSALDNFKQTQVGELLRPIIEDRENIRDMIALSRHDIPAVQAIGKQVLALGPEVKEDFVKQSIGKWVREILEAEGYAPLRQGRVARGYLFSTGMVYTNKKRPADDDEDDE